MRIADEQDKMTTWSINNAFMIDNGDLCTREEMERVGWDKTRDTVSVSEDLATGGIRAHLVSAKGDIEEFGHGGALVRFKSDQEPAIVDVQRLVIVRWRFAIQPTSGKRVKKVRNMVKTILSSLASRWSIRVTRDHPVNPWAADKVCKRGKFGKDSG